MHKDFSWEKRGREKEKERWKENGRRKWDLLSPETWKVESSSYISMRWKWWELERERKRKREKKETGCLFRRENTLTVLWERILLSFLHSLSRENEKEWSTKLLLLVIVVHTLDSAFLSLSWREREREREFLETQNDESRKSVTVSPPAQFSTSSFSRRKELMTKIKSVSDGNFLLFLLLSIETDWKEETSSRRWIFLSFKFKEKSERKWQLDDCRDGIVLNEWIRAREWMKD